MKLRNAVLGLVLAVATVFGATACATGQGYQQSYVVARTMCGIQYCLVMSDGDVVVVQPSVWDSIMYGMLLQPYNGGYRFYASSSVATRRISTVSYSQYRSVPRVNPSTEYSQQRTGSTYNSGGSRYTSSPVYRASQAAARAARQTGGYSPGKTGYTPQKQGYTPQKQGGYNPHKSSYGGSSYKSSYKSH